MSLHDELSRLADTAPRPDIDHTLWDRGRALCRRDRLVTSALALAMVVFLGSVAALALSPQRSVDPAHGPVPQGAIPSRIEDIGTDRLGETDLAIGRASVAFISGITNLPIVVGASDGRYHHLDMSPPLALALSPDGRRLAWAMPDRLHIADLETGDVLEFAHNGGHGARVTSMYWLPDSVSLVWRGRDEGLGASAVLDVTGPAEQPTTGRVEYRGIPSPGGDVFALPSDGTVAAAPFLQWGDGPGGGHSSESIDRSLPADLYPDGASVLPLGWASDDLLLAKVNALNGSDVEGQHLALLTSPDQPKSQWTYRILVRDLPPNPVSIAVDLIPDLDGTSNQQLTHDFGEPDWPGDSSPWRDRAPGLLGGLLALLAGLAFIRMLQRQ